MCIYTWLWFGPGQPHIHRINTDAKSGWRSQREPEASAGLEVWISAKSLERGTGCCVVAVAMVKFPQLWWTHQFLLLLSMVVMASYSWPVVRIVLYGYCLWLFLTYPLLLWLLHQQLWLCSPPGLPPCPVSQPWQGLWSLRQWQDWLSGESVEINYRLQIAFCWHSPLSSGWSTMD